MSGLQYASLAQHFSLLPPYYTIDEHGQPVLQPTAFMPPDNMQFFPHQAPEGMSAGFDPEDASRGQGTAQSNSKSRRRIGASGEHVKFRRTRSGCYTCRNRRVKCDEGRPTCERCKKGNRDCSYPEPTTNTKSRRTGSKNKPSQGDGSSQESEGEGDLDEDYLLSSMSGEPANFATSPTQSELSTANFFSDNLSREQSRESPGTEGEPRYMTRRTSSISTTRPRSKSGTFSKLQPEMRFYMEYAKANLTPYHWNYAPDGSDFLSVTLLEAAVRYEPLLYAVTCFAAYHHTLSRPDGQIEHFLIYHSKSVALLHQSLLSSSKHTIAMLLTILQLATIEESLGDWVSLMSHQKAAYSILKELYTPETIMKHPILQNIFKWYLHFDTYVCMLSGTTAVIPRHWIEYQLNYYAEEAKKHPDNLVKLYEQCMARLRLDSFDVFNLFSAQADGKLSNEEFLAQAEVLDRRIDRLIGEVPPTLTDPSKTITSFPNAPPRDPDDIVDPYEPGLIFGGERFPTNQYRLSILGLRNVFDTRMAAFRGTNIAEDSKKLAWNIVKVIDAVEHWPESPKGAILSFRSILSLGSFSLPHGEKEMLWIRRKMAKVEAQGYIYPDSIRNKLGAMWAEDLSGWWLPNDEGLPPVIRHIREFIAERTRVFQDAKSTSLRDMKGIFANLSLSDASSPESMSSPNSSSIQQITDRSSSEPALQQSQDQWAVDGQRRKSQGAPVPLTRTP